MSTGREDPEKSRENVKMSWKRPSKQAIARALRHRAPFAAGQRPVTLTELLGSAARTH